MCIYVVSTNNVTGAERLSRLRQRVQGTQFVVATTEAVTISEPFVDATTSKFLTGTVGCTRSHFKAWQMFIDTGAPYALFLEDDVVIRDTKLLESRILSLCETRTEAPLLIQWGWLELGKIGVRRLVSMGYHLLMDSGPPLDGFVRGYGFGNHCYMMNRSMALYMSNLLYGKWDAQITEGSDDDIRFPCAMPLDYFIMTMLKTQALADCIVVRSLVNYATQEGADSSITEEFDPTLKGRNKDSSNQFRGLKTFIMSMSEAQGTRLTMSDLQSILVDH